MTPQRAAERMQEIKKREKGIELLIEIAHKTGFYRAAEIFEKLPSRDD